MVDAVIELRGNNLVRVGVGAVEINKFPDKSKTPLLNEVPSKRTKMKRRVYF